MVVDGDREHPLGVALADHIIVEMLADLERRRDSVALAVPLPAMATALDGLTVDPDATITDLGSVKRPVLESVGAAYGSRFVGGHPMAGTERSGHDATDPGLFTGARWAVCLEPDTELPRWLRVAEVALAVGAEVVPVTAAEHDDAVAAISHVSHLLAAALAAAAADAGPLALGAGRGELPRRHAGGRQ